MTDEDSLDAEVQQTLVREEIGLKEDERTKVRDTLTPIDRVTPDLVIMRQGFSFLARAEENRPPHRKQAALAIACLQIYAKLNQRWRDEARARNEEFKRMHGYVPPTLKEHEGRGKNILVVDYARVTPEGPHGRYILSFTATNIDYEGDRRTESSAFMFDVEPRELNRPYPARLQSNWTVGRKDRKWEIVGTYKDLLTESDGMMDELLAGKGYKEIAEVWPMILDNHTGFLDESVKLPSPTEASG